MWQYEVFGHAGAINVNKCIQHTHINKAGTIKGDGN